MYKVVIQIHVCIELYLGVDCQLLVLLLLCIELYLGVDSVSWSFWYSESNTFNTFNFKCDTYRPYIDSWDVFSCTAQDESSLSMGYFRGRRVQHHIRVNHLRSLRRTGRTFVSSRTTLMVNWG